MISQLSCSLPFHLISEKMSWRRIVCFWLTASVYTTESFSHPFYLSHNSISDFPSTSHAFLIKHIIPLRCGQQDSEHSSNMSSASTHQLSKRRSSMVLLPAIPQLQTVGKAYARLLQQYPIRTKSVTAGCIFAISAILAQMLEKKVGLDEAKQTGIQWSRVLSSSLVGLFYFGPAAHYWYEWVFRILPAVTLSSTLQKAFLGQMLFGPSFTCIFFATSLMQNGTFTVPSWIRKIRTDLPAAWLAGAGFWPIVDLVSYSFIAPQWIPLFINVCSLFWTTYLILKSYS
jgi:protein Mpv17